jgi:small Trp-rich protein
MYLVYIGAVLVALKAFEVKYFADASWWWILAPLALAAFYFEVIEPMFGFDKKKAHTEAEEYKIKRQKAQLKADWTRKK